MLIFQLLLLLFFNHFHCHHYATTTPPLRHHYATTTPPPRYHATTTLPCYHYATMPPPRHHATATTTPLPLRHHHHATATTGGAQLESVFGGHEQYRPNGAAALWWLHCGATPAARSPIGQECGLQGGGGEWSLGDLILWFWEDK